MKTTPKLKIDLNSFGKKEKFTANDFDEWMNFEETLDKQFDCFFKHNYTKVTSSENISTNTPNLSTTYVVLKHISIQNHLEKLLINLLILTKLIMMF